MTRAGKFIDKQGGGGGEEATITTLHLQRSATTHGSVLPATPDSKDRMQTLTLFIGERGKKIAKEIRRDGERGLRAYKRKEFLLLFLCSKESSQTMQPVSLYGANDERTHAGRSSSG